MQRVNMKEQSQFGCKYLILDTASLTHQVPVLPSYRNQSIDLLCKSMDWFLYKGNTSA